MRVVASTAAQEHGPWEKGLNRSVQDSSSYRAFEPKELLGHRLQICSKDLAGSVTAGILNPGGDQAIAETRTLGTAAQQRECPGKLCKVGPDEFGEVGMALALESCLPNNVAADECESSVCIEGKVHGAAEGLHFAREFPDFRQMVLTLEPGPTDVEKIELSNFKLAKNFTQTAGYYDIVIPKYPDIFSPRHVIALQKVGVGADV